MSSFNFAVNLQNQHKILLLGTGNSGKVLARMSFVNTVQSTFCKQLTAKYGGSNPHFQNSNEEVIASLQDNTLSCVHKLLAAVADKSAKENKVNHCESFS